MSKTPATRVARAGDETGKKKMKDWMWILAFLGFLALWFAVQKWVLPKLGVPT